MEEIWKEIPGFEGYYEASTEGNIRSIDRVINCPWGKRYPAKGKRKSICAFRTGYLYVNLYKEHKYYKKSVHRLVALTFIPNPDDKPCIDHIDGDRANNKVSNLRWCTRKENANNPITVKRLAEACRSESRNKKLSESTRKRAKPVIQLSLSGKPIKEWRSAIIASKELNICRTSIYLCIHGKRKYAGGYLWKYKSFN